MFACGLADRPDRAWIRTFYKSASWCSYFGILLIRLLQLNHSKICLFWDHTTVVNQVNSAVIWWPGNENGLVARSEPLCLFLIYRARAVYEYQTFFQRAHTERTASRPQGDICWIWQKVYWIRIADFTFKAKLLSTSQKSRWVANLQASLVFKVIFRWVWFKCQSPAWVPISGIMQHPYQMWSYSHLSNILIFFTADIFLSYLSRKSTCGAANINNGSALVSVPGSLSSEPACTVQGPWTWLT